MTKSTVRAEDPDDDYKAIDPSVADSPLWDAPLEDLQAALDDETNPLHGDAQKVLLAAFSPVREMLAKQSTEWSEKLAKAMSPSVRFPLPMADSAWGYTHVTLSAPESEPDESHEVELPADEDTTPLAPIKTAAELLRTNEQHAMDQRAEQIRLLRESLDLARTQATQHEKDAKTSVRQQTAIIILTSAALLGTIVSIIVAVTSTGGN